jgi:hypothetical protein
VSKNDGRETDDVDPVADLQRARIDELKRGHVGRVEPQQGEVLSRHRLAGNRRAVLHDRGPQLKSVGQEDADRRLERRNSRRCCAVGARLADRLRHPCADHRVGRTIGGSDHMTVGDEPPGRVHEPSRAGYAIRRRDDIAWRCPAFTAHRHGAARLGDDERHARLGAKERFLKRDRLRGGYRRHGERRHGHERNSGERRAHHGEL